MWKCQASRVSLVLPRHCIHRRNRWASQFTQSNLLNHTQCQSLEQPKNEVGAHLFLWIWMLFAQSFSSTKGLTVECRTLEEKAKESRMMAKGCMVAIPCRDENCLTSWYKCYQAPAWSLCGFCPSSSDGPPKSWCIWIILALAAMISMISNSLFLLLWPSL